MQAKGFVTFELWPEHGYLHSFIASSGQERGRTGNLQLVAGCKQSFQEPAERA